MRAHAVAARGYSSRLGWQCTARPGAAGLAGRYGSRRLTKEEAGAGGELRAHGRKDGGGVRDAASRTLPGAELNARGRGLERSTGPSPLPSHVCRRLLRSR